MSPEYEKNVTITGREKVPPHSIPEKERNQSMLRSNFEPRCEKLRMARKFDILDFYGIFFYNKL